MADRMPLPVLQGGLATRAGFDYPIGVALSFTGSLVRAHVGLDAPSSAGDVVAEIRDSLGAVLGTVTVPAGQLSVDAAFTPAPSVPALDPITLRLTSVGTGALGLSGWIELDAGIAAPGAGGDLTTLAQVKAYGAISGTEADVLLATLISAASERIKRYLRRDLVPATYTDQELDGPGTLALRLPQYPVTAISAVTLEGSALAGTDYSLEASSGLLYYTPGGGDPAPWPRGRRNVTVTYDAGFAALPADLMLAATITVVWDYKRTGAGGSRLGDRASVVGDDTAQFLVDPWAPDALAILRGFRRVEP